MKRGKANISKYQSQILKILDLKHLIRDWILLLSSQDIMHYAAKIIRIALGGPEGNHGFGTAEKRNSGLLNTVLDMPDLERYGRRK